MFPSCFPSFSSAEHHSAQWYLHEYLHFASSIVHLFGGGLNDQPVARSGGRRQTNGNFSPERKAAPFPIFLSLLTYCWHAAWQTWTRRVERVPYRRMSEHHEHGSSLNQRPPHESWVGNTKELASPSLWNPHLTNIHAFIHSKNHYHGPFMGGALEMPSSPWIHISSMPLGQQISLEYLLYTNYYSKS